MRNRLTKEQAEQILSPFIPTITGSVKKGFRDYINSCARYSEKRSLELKARTKATMIHNLIIERIREAFEDAPGITVKEYRDVFGLHFRNQVFIRFNKFNSRLEPTKARTKQRTRFENQQTVIPGFPRKPMFLYAGYTFTPSMTGIGSINISCRFKGNKEWMMEIFSHKPVQRQIAIGEPQEKLVKVKQTNKLRKAS
ncbi:MAG TPA: hypothetical protein VNW99_07920 [Cytophagaceae bacterium]|nr:hypothetical protein [Cytophagaceae bacterium]